MAGTGYKQEWPPWSDLPIELMELILQLCDVSDQVRIQAVCMRWQSIPKVQPLTQLPWLMAYDDRNWSRCKLFDLTYDKTCTVNISAIKEHYIEKKPGITRICASKSGWLLLSHSIYGIAATAFLLYNPFINRMIQLPDLDSFYFWGDASISADPTCADSVFFVFHYSYHTHAYAASTYRLGDSMWATREFPLDRPIESVVYSQGQFWCATSWGTLVTFSVAQGIWNVFELLIPDTKFLFDVNVEKETRLVESNGDLLLLISHKQKPRHVFKLDRSQMAWILMEDVGDLTLFLGPTSLSVSKVPAQLGLTEKIYYSGNIYYCWGPEGRLLRNCCGLSKIWIEPPC